MEPTKVVETLQWLGVTDIAFLLLMILSRLRYDEITDWHPDHTMFDRLTGLGVIGFGVCTFLWFTIGFKAL